MAAFFLLELMLTAIVIVFFFGPLFFSSPGLPVVTLASLTVSRFNFTGDHVSGYLNMQFQVLNPNLVTDFSYDDVYCSVYHGKHRLASTMFPGFVQKAIQTTPMNLTVHLALVTTAKGIGNDLATDCLEEFDVKLITFIKWKFGSSKYVRVRVSCDDVAVGLQLTTAGHRKMIGPAMKCQVF